MSLVLKLKGEGMKLEDIQAVTGVPMSTVCERLTGRSKCWAKPGPKPILPSDAENDLLSWIA